MMQNPLSGAATGGTHIRTDNINGNHGLDRTNYVQSSDRNFILEEVDPSQLGDDHDDSHSDSEATDIQQLQLQHAPDRQQQDGSQLQMQMDMGLPKPSKKTKGRVKIKMEFIENKLRRYTTFSKRKTGIMKKAYELSTLTGTQVMLLVASETGHVYTFATRKLQPMITSESGKALIQTCLNSPDQGPSNGPQSNIEQRMNPTGFEETELTYTVSEEESKSGFSEGLTKPLLSVPGGLSAMQGGGGEGIGQQAVSSIGGASQHFPITLTPHTNTTSPTPTSSPPTLFLSQPHGTPTPPPAPTASIKASSSTTSTTSMPANISMQLPAGFVLQPAGSSISIPIQQAAGQTSQTTTQAQPLFSLPGQTQFLTMANLQQQTASQADSTVTVSSSSNSLSNIPSNLNLVSASGSGSSGGLMTPNYVMYQTPQGIVFATPASATINDRTIFNFQQPATAISLPQQDSSQVGGSQLIIPIPVSSTGAGQQFSQVLQLTAASDSGSSVADLSVQPPRPKKSRSK